MNVMQIARKRAKEIGLANLTRADLAGVLGIPEGSFSGVTGTTFSAIRDALLAEGVPLGSGDNRQRLKAKMRRELILQAALDLAVRVGYLRVSRAELAEAAGVTVTTISTYFKDAPTLQGAILEAAITKRIPEILAQALAVGDPIAAQAPEGLKRKAAHYVRNQ